MKSLAFWCKKNADTPEPVIDCHINFWKLPKENGSDFERFLDIGLKLDKISDISTVFIYVPCKINPTEVYDLGKTICGSDANLLNAIFNEKYSITIDSTSDYYQVKKPSQQGPAFNIYALGSENIELEKSYHDGTLIKIKMPNNSVKKTNTYIRIRIRSKNLEDLSTIEKSPASVLGEAFTNIEIFDFRINSLRHLPNKVNEEISDQGSFKIQKIHFFYICSYKEIYVLSHSPFSGARQLEKGLWDDYISTTSNIVNFEKDKAFIAYQWTESCSPDKQIKQFNAFIKTEYRHRNWGTIIKYLIYISLFSLVIGLLTNFCYDLGKSYFGKVPKEDITDSTGPEKAK